ncbi:geranylgeranyl pyrophosphate synthetase, partial [Glonium stellatum]
PSPPLGPLLEEISEFDLLNAAQFGDSRKDTAEINGCTYIASFNWLDQDKPTILIPGTPPAWTPLLESRALEQDKGEYFRDPNAARFPTYPLEPAVRAVLTENEDLETQKIDLFACSSTVGSLLRFVRRVDKPFRFFVEVVGNTVFFIRHENTPTELIPEVKGYGHTFPEAYTTWNADVKGSASHQRLLRYDFAGLDCVLRFEADGYLGFMVPGGVKTPASASDLRNDKSQDDLASTLDSMKVSSSFGGGERSSGPLQIEITGQKIPQEAIFDLKTRSAWKKELDVLGEELPRCWVAQIPNFILAFHEAGMFNDITVRYIRDDVKKWQQENQKDIKCLNWLVRKIIAIAKARKDGKLEVRYKGLEALELREQDTDEHNVLPPDLKLRWMENDPSDDVNPRHNAKSTGGVSLPVSVFDTSAFGSDEEDEDYTACSDECGYCGRCTY